MIRASFLFFLLLCFQWVQAQTMLNGKVIDDSNQPIFNASVLVKHEADNILYFGFTDQQGAYSIEIESKGNFVVEVKKIGFARSFETLRVTPDQKKYTIEFVLDKNVEELKEIVIEVKNPIQLRGDTLVFDAKSWTTGREQVVEDLLKNLPGIEVQKDGKIKFEDKVVESVMVGGDDLFDSGYTLLTKNMPNKPLDKVEIIRKHSKNKLLKGFQKSEGVAINLTIDKEYENIWFGDIGLAYDLDSKKHYDATGNLMNFSDSYKNFLNAGTNNVGVDRVGSLSEMFFNNNEIESVGTTRMLYPIMSLSAYRAPLLKDYRTRINSQNNVSLSSIVPLSEKVKIRLTGFLGLDKNYAYSNRNSITNVNAAYFENNETQDFNSRLNSGYINFLGTYDISEKQMLQVSSIYYYGTQNNEDNLTFNGLNTLEKLESRNAFIDQKATYTHKWNDRIVLLFKTRFFSNELPQKYHIDDYLMGDLFAFDAKQMKNDFDNSKTYFGTEVDLRTKQNSDNWGVQFGYENSLQKISSHFSLWNETISFNPEGYQTKGKFGSQDSYINTNYRFHFKKVELNTKVSAHYVMNHFSNLQSDKQKGFFYVNPMANLQWDIKPKQTIIASYNLRFYDTNILEVNDAYLLSSSRSFHRGLGDFRLTYNQSANVSYNINHFLNRYIFRFMLDYEKQNKMLSSRQLIEQNSSLSESVYIDGGDRYGAKFHANYYWRKIKSTFVLELGYDISNFYNEVNNSGLRENKFYGKRYRFEWKTNLKIPFNFYAGTEWDKSSVESPNFKSDYTNGFSYFDVYFTSDKWTAKVVTEHYYFGSLEKSQRNHLFMDVEVLHKLKEGKYEIFLRGNNLFNKRDFTTFSMSDVGYSKTTYRLLPRFVLLGFKTRFSL